MFVQKNVYEKGKIFAARERRRDEQQEAQMARTETQRRRWSPALSGCDLFIAGGDDDGTCAAQQRLALEEVPTLFPHAAPHGGTPSPGVRNARGQRAPPTVKFAAKAPN